MSEAASTVVLYPGTPATAAPLAAVEEVTVSRAEGTLQVAAVLSLASADSAYLAAHFPGFRIYPGVFALETVCQAVAAALTATGGPEVRLAGAEQMRFLAPWLADDVIRAEAAVSPAINGYRAMAVCRRRDGTVCARLTLLFAERGEMRA